MVFPKARLVVSAGLFLAWIGFLAYLVARTRDPVILSRPQLLVSNLVVIAELSADEGHPSSNIRVKEVLRAGEKSDHDLVGKELQAIYLAECRAPHGWDGAGLYLVPLTKVKGAQESIYYVTILPVVPGYKAKLAPDTRIYRVTDDAMAQWHEIAAPRRD